MKELDPNLKLPVFLKQMRQQDEDLNRSEKQVVGHVAEYNGLAIIKQYHSPISKMVNLTALYDGE